MKDKKPFWNKANFYPGSVAYRIFRSECRDIEYLTAVKDITIKSTKSGDKRTYKFLFKWIDEDNYITTVLRKVYV